MKDLPDGPDISVSRRTAMAGMLGAGALAAAPALAKVGQADAFVFAYFAGGQDETPGLRLATSDDGLNFRAVRDGAIMLTPEVGERKLMRDPCLMRGHGPDAPWHLVWTTAWEGVTLGHATSHDLIHWSPQTAIPVMAAVVGTRNVWAPEMIWDPIERHYVMFWSSTVRGRFPETADASEDGYNHRLWYATTRDFVTVSPAKLLWDPGFSVIDATFLVGPRGALHLIVKDETLKPPKKHLRLARAASPTGPFTDLSAPFSPDWVEGPTAIRIGGWAYVFYDRYRDGAWGAVRSRDLRTWEDVSSHLVLPKGARHGTVVRVPGGMAQTLRT